MRFLKNGAAILFGAIVELPRAFRVESALSMRRKGLLSDLETVRRLMRTCDMSPEEAWETVREDSL